MPKKEKKGSRREEYIKLAQTVNEQLGKFQGSMDTSSKTGKLTEKQKKKLIKNLIQIRSYGSHQIASKKHTQKQIEEIQTHVGNLHDNLETMEKKLEILQRSYEAQGLGKQADEINALLAHLEDTQEAIAGHKDHLSMLHTVASERPTVAEEMVEYDPLHWRHSPFTPFRKLYYMFADLFRVKPPEDEEGK
jgi:predicted mannosyl-3-phosphoglycerate phosphatase (HAD superfamily)